MQDEKDEAGEEEKADDTTLLRRSQALVFIVSQNVFKKMSEN